MAHRPHHHRHAHRHIQVPAGQPHHSARQRQQRRAGRGRAVVRLQDRLSDRREGVRRRRRRQSDRRRRTTAVGRVQRQQQHQGLAAGARGQENGGRQEQEVFGTGHRSRVPDPAEKAPQVDGARLLDARGGPAVHAHVGPRVPHVHVHIRGHHGGQDGQVHRPARRAQLRFDVAQVVDVRCARHVTQLHNPVLGEKTRPRFQVTKSRFIKKTNINYTQNRVLMAVPYQYNLLIPSGE